MPEPAMEMHQQRKRLGLQRATFGVGEARPAAQIENRGPGWQPSSPITHGRRSNAGPSCTAPTRQKLRRHSFVSIRSIHLGLPYQVH
jgi:hypothetical protein